MPKLKARMDVYRVGRNMFSFVASSVDALLRLGKLKEHDLLNLPLSTKQRFEQDAGVLTMVGSFLDFSGATSTRLLEEAILDESASEGTCRHVGISLS